MKNKILIFIILSLYIVIVSIITLVLLTKSYNSKEIKKKYFTEIEKNFSRHLIKTIKIQKTECLNNTKNLLNFEFSGTEIFCHCSNGINYVDSCKISEYRSIYNLFGPLCKNINNMNSYNLKTIKKIHFCAEFSKLRYSQIINLNSEKKNCEKGFKICGKDSKEYLCFPEKIKCPINDLIISNIEKKDLKQKNYKEQKIDNFYL